MLIWTKPDRPFDRRNKCGGGVVAPGEGRSIFGPGPFLPAINSTAEGGRFGPLANRVRRTQEAPPEPTLLSPFSDFVDLVSPR